MSRKKTIPLPIDEDLLSKIDCLLEAKGLKNYRSTWIREAIMFYYAHCMQQVKLMNGLKQAMNKSENTEETQYLVDILIEAGKKWWKREQQRSKR